ncbi:fimbrial biogenesis chaperone [Massilia soli]|uniref:Fimbria/pilus periplasmic chaperone n=1 Tax=Massilia soli TaxID=2792854 RepID=A0ABS7SUB0_9BURK|nr:fimbria/pilus periplasmic chaperone [Massilia soli]MBZ2209526.1 fimbria/pilus periplasmic chaperone [Massilia soli]
MRRILTLLLFAIALAGAGAQAANLQISPVMINFKAGQNAAGISMQNFGDAPVYGQVRVYLWDQRDGDDVLTPTDQVVASPPIIQIPAKSTQTIRLIQRGAAAASIEQSYRILIDEIPRDDGPATGVDIRLRYSVPVFIFPADERAAPQLQWSVLRKQGEWMLSVHNAGSLHAQIGATRLRSVAGKEFEVSKGLLGYALAGRTREWRLAVDKTADLSGAVVIESNVNAKATSAVAKQ